MFCSATAKTKTALGVIQLWFIYCAASFFKALVIRFSRKGEEERHAYAFLPVSILAYDDGHSSLPAGPSFKPIVLRL